MSVIVTVEFIVMMVAVIGWNRYRNRDMVMMMSYLKIKMEY